MNESMSKQFKENENYLIYSDRRVFSVKNNKFLSIEKKL